MGIGDKFDQLKDKAKDALGQHGDKVEQGVDKARDFVDDKTGGKHSDKLDKGAEALKDRMPEGDQGQAR